MHLKLPNPDDANLIISIQRQEHNQSLESPQLTHNINNTCVPTSWLILIFWYLSPPVSFGATSGANSRYVWWLTIDKKRSLLQWECAWIIGCRKKETTRFSLWYVCHDVQKNHESVLVGLMRITWEKIELCAVLGSTLKLLNYLDSVLQFLIDLGGYVLFF